MRQLTSEIVNGAIFAALVVLASEMQRLAPQHRPAEISQGTTAGPAFGGDVRTTRTESFAAALARSSFAPDATRDTSAMAVFPVSNDPSSAPAVGQVVRDKSDPGTASAAPQQPVAALSERIDAKPPASKIPDDSKIDAYVPPIKRQRPVTPPLAFNAPAGKAASGSAGKATKTKVKRAAARKGQEAARSSLGAGARAKVAGDAAPKADQAAQSKAKQ